MVDEPLQSEEVLASENQPAEKRPTPSAWNIVGVLVLLVVLVLIVLLLKDCGGLGDTQGAEQGGKTIVAVPRYEPLPGVVSVWVSKDTTINKVLAATSVRSEGVISLGGGRYVVAVGEGAEQVTIDTLKSRPGVFDAGLVYDQNNPRR